jgi:hypothetical protein
MAGKISDLTTLTDPVTADLIEVLDVSDTSMAPTGTNKKLSIASLNEVTVSNVAPTGTPPRNGLLWVVV